MVYEIFHPFQRSDHSTGENMIKQSTSSGTNDSTIYPYFTKLIMVQPRSAPHGFLHYIKNSLNHNRNQQLFSLTNVFTNEDVLRAKNTNSLDSYPYIRKDVSTYIIKNKFAFLKLSILAARHEVLRKFFLRIGLLQ